MHRLYKSHQSTTPQFQKKGIDLDQYDSDSEEEDQRREQTEIKQIISKARIKNTNKFKIRDIPTSERFRTTHSKFESLMSPQNPTQSKTADINGFFSNAPLPGESIIKRDFAEEMKRLSQPKPKVEIKTQPTPRDTRGLLLDTDRLYIGTDKPDQHELRNKEPKRKTTEILKNPKDIEFQKQSFNNLLSFYSKSSTKYPVRSIPNRSNRTSKNPSPRLFAVDGRRDLVDLQISFDAKLEITEEDKEQEGIEVKDFQELIPELISASLTNAWEALDKKHPAEVPRFKTMDWSEMMKKIDSNKLELLIIDPINLAVEDCLEINSDDPQKVKDTMNEAIKETIPNMNEAKHILAFYYDKSTNKKKLLFSKFLFFIKNHRYYVKNLKNEKEIIIHYLLILVLLEFRMNYETNPFKDDKIENSKKKAFNMFKNTEPLNSYVLEWLTMKMQPIIAVEKVYINLNVGGKADSNFTFNMHEHLCYAYPKFSQYLVNKVKNAGLKAIATVEKEKITASDMISARDSGERRETASPVPSSTKDFRYSPRIPEKSNYINANISPKQKSGTAQSQNEPQNHFKPQMNSTQTGMYSPRVVRSTLSSPFTNSKFNYYGEAPMEIEQPSVSIGQRSMSLTGQAFFPSSARIMKVENKVYLSNNNQRMNTSYGHFLRQRIGK